MNGLQGEAIGGLRILQITDFHLFGDPRTKLLGVNTQNTFDAVLGLARMRDWPPDVIVVTGDLAQDGSAETYRRLRGHLVALDVPIYWLPGNHDDISVMADCLSGDNVKAEGSFCKGKWQVILLDSTVPDKVGGYLGEDELERLDRCLDGHPDYHALICLHHQPVSIGCAWMEPIGLDNAGPFFAVVDRHPQVRGVVWGHVHQDLTVQRKGVPLLAAPSTCFQFKPNSDKFTIDGQLPGYRLLLLQPDGAIQTEVRRLEDFVMDVETAATGY